MSSPSPSLAPSSPEKPTSKWDFVEQAIKVGTGSFAVIYAAGFLLVSIHHSQYHIVMFEFLRARVFAAGILFALFLMLPVIAASRWFGVLGLGQVIEIKEEHREKFGFMKGCTFYVFASGMAWFANILFSSSYSQIRHPLWILALPAPIIALVAYGFWAKRSPYLLRHSYLVGLVSVLTLGLSVYADWKAYGTEMLVVSLWFFLIGNCFLSLHTKFSRSAEIRTHNWELSFLYSLGFIALFANLIYGRIKPEWGGGLSTPITVHFSRPTSFSNSVNTTAYLIDETDKGFYVTHTPDDHKASFIPREAVASVDFEETK
jgi:hypothetical protein